MRDEMEMEWKRRKKKERKKESVMALPESPLHPGVEEEKEFLGK